MSEQKKLEINELNKELKEALNKNIENERKIKEADLNEENYRITIKTLEDLLAKLQSGVTKLENSSENQSVLQQQVERLEKELVEVCMKQLKKFMPYHILFRFTKCLPWKSKNIPR